MSNNERLSFLQSNEENHHKISLGFNPCKNLSEIFTSLEAVGSEHLKVYLRVRPSLQSEDISEEKNIQIEDTSHIVASAPVSSHAYKNKPHGAAKVSQRFLFTHIYDQQSTQKQLFEDTTQKLIKEFIDGQNCLFFSYGATNSGKTYTIQGDVENPGVLPRSLEFLFQGIGDKHYKGNDLMPQHFCGVVRLSQKQISKEQENRESLFKIASDTSTLSKTNLSTCSTFSRDSETDSNSSTCVPKVSDLCTDECQEISQNYVYAVFVSFAEIYKENIYDLLDKSSSLKKGPLVLGEDNHGAIYIKGLKEIRARNIEEALQILEAGRQSLHFASTTLNRHSSRSHSIFTIKLIRLAHPDSPHVANVSMLSLCDLAGTERAGKTLNTQDRLKEASNINTSLLVLGRCITALRQNQQHQNTAKKLIPVPYRDSKITRLFQSFFMGRGRMAMIVNVCTSSNLFDETLKVLKFSAIAQKVAITQDKSYLEHLEESRRNSHFAQLMRQSFNMSTSSGRVSVPWANTALSDVTFGGNENLTTLAEEEDEEGEEEERIKNLLDLIKTLKDKVLQENKEKQELESKLRKELCNDFGRKLVEIEDSWRNRVKEERVRAEEYMDWRVDHIMKSTGSTRKRRRSENPVDNDEEMVPSILLVREELKANELELEKNLLKEELVALKSSLKISDSQVKTSQIEISKLNFMLAYEKPKVEPKSKEEEEQISSESDSVNNLLIGQLQEKNSDLQRSIKEKENEISEIKAMLDEAAEEFIEKEQKIFSLKEFISSDKEKITQQSLTISELESKLAEVEQMADTQRHLLEECEHDLECQAKANDEKMKEGELHSQSASEKIKRLEDLLGEKEETILNLEKECCNLSEKISSLEDPDSTANQHIKSLESSFQKQLRAQQEVYSLKLEKEKNVHKDMSEEKELLTFKVSELELEVSALKEGSERSLQSICESEVSPLHSLAETNVLLEQRIESLEEAASLKQKECVKLCSEMNILRDCLDSEIDEKTRLEEKLDSAVQLEKSLKEKLLLKEMEISDLSKHVDELQSANSQVSSLKASKSEFEERVENLELKLKESEKARESVKLLCGDYETKLKVAQENESELKDLLLKMDAKLKALYNLKDDLIQENRSLNSEIEKLKTSSEKLNEKLNEIEDSNINKEKQIAEQGALLNSFIDELKVFKTLEFLSDDYDQEIQSSICDELKTLREKIANAMNSMNSQIQKLKAEKSSCVENLSLKGSELESAKEEVSRLKTTLLEIKEENGRLEAEVSKSEAEQRNITSLLDEESRTKSQLIEYKEMLAKSISKEEAIKNEKQELLLKVMSLEKRLADKDERAANLMSKIGALDKKLSEVEEESIQIKSKSSYLEKEVAAVRSARSEEVSQLEASIDSKNDEIVSLQQEMKRIIQSSTLTDVSSRTSCQSMKLEPTDCDASCLSASAKINKVPLKEENVATTEISDAEIKTPATSCRTRRQRKAHFEHEPETPGGSESLRLVLEGSDIETPVVSRTKTRSTRKNTQCSDSFEKVFKAPPPALKKFDSGDESDSWEPLNSNRKTRSTRGRKTKNKRETNVYNPHLENPRLENKENSGASDASAENKTSSAGKSARGRRRALYNADACTLENSPNIIEIGAEKDDLGTVRRQLRRRK